METIIEQEEMVEYNKILAEPYNPIILSEDEVRFPEWLSSAVIIRSNLPKVKNMTDNDHIIGIHASFYDATVWYPWLTSWTPKSQFMELSDEEVTELIYEQTMPDHRKEQITKYLDEGYNFVKSSKKSSHQCGKILTYEQFIDEITHPDIIMSFKKGCRHIFFRKFIDDIRAEYRIYVYKNQIRYIEEYIKKNKSLTTEEAFWRKVDIISYVTGVMADIKYQDFILDICMVPANAVSNAANAATADISEANAYMVIEINTPMYLFGGIHLGTYSYDAERIHSAPSPIFRYRDEADQIDEV